MKTWFGRFFSIEESKVSTLIVCLLFLVGFGCSMYYKTGEFNGEIANIICVICGSIAGTNIIGVLGQNKDKQMEGLGQNYIASSTSVSPPATYYGVEGGEEQSWI